MAIVAGIVTVFQNKDSVISQFQMEEELPNVKYTCGLEAQ